MIKQSITENNVVFSDFSKMTDTDLLTLYRQIVADTTIGKIKYDFEIKTKEAEIEDEILTRMSFREEE